MLTIRVGHTRDYDRLTSGVGGIPRNHRDIGTSGENLSTLERGQI